MDLETISVILFNAILWSGMYLFYKHTEKKFKAFEDNNDLLK